jgi:hypothetical protein
METNPVEMKSAVVHKEVSEEDATVNTGRVLKKWHRGRHLATRHCGKPKERTQGCGKSVARMLLMKARKPSACAAVN